MWGRSELPTSGVSPGPHRLRPPPPSAARSLRGRGESWGNSCEPRLGSPAWTGRSSHSSRCCKLGRSQGKNISNFSPKITLRRGLGWNETRSLNPWPAVGILKLTRAAFWLERREAPGWRPEQRGEDLSSRLSWWSSSPGNTLPFSSQPSNSWEIRNSQIIKQTTPLKFFLQEKKELFLCFYH